MEVGSCLICGQRSRTQGPRAEAEKHGLSPWWECMADMTTSIPRPCQHRCTSLEN